MYTAIRRTLATSCMVLLVAMPQTARAQRQTPLLSTDSSTLDVAAQAGSNQLNPYRLAFVSGGLVLANVALYRWEKDRWFVESWVPFHFDDKLDYARNVDKLAHFYATSVFALLVARSFQWSGVKHRPATLIGSVGAFLMQMHMELYDARQPSWGFDVTTWRRTPWEPHGSMRARTSRPSIAFMSVGSTTPPMRGLCGRTTTAGTATGSACLSRP